MQRHGVFPATASMKWCGSLVPLVELRNIVGLSGLLKWWGYLNKATTSIIWFDTTMHTWRVPKTELQEPPILAHKREAEVALTGTGGTPIEWCHVPVDALPANRLLSETWWWWIMGSPVPKQRHIVPSTPVSATPCSILKNCQEFYRNRSSVCIDEISRVNDSQYHRLTSLIYSLLFEVIPA